MRCKDSQLPSRLLETETMGNESGDSVVSKFLVLNHLHHLVSLLSASVSSACKVKEMTELTSHGFYEDE